MRFLALLLIPLMLASTTDDAATVARLDEAYQAAVKANDVAGMDSILADDFVLVVGKGTVYTKRQLIDAARTNAVTYERQEDSQRTVRMLAPNAAVVTALLWEKGVQNGKAFDRKLWFSDIYIRTARGWKYAFAQASLPLPD